MLLINMLAMPCTTCGAQARCGHHLSFAAKEGRHSDFGMPWVWVWWWGLGGFVRGLHQPDTDSFGADTFPNDSGSMVTGGRGRGIQRGAVVSDAAEGVTLIRL